MEVRQPHDGELPAVMTVLDGGLLATSAETVRAAIESGRVLVAVEEGRVLGALVIDRGDDASDTRIIAIAVRRGRRGQGLGTALVRSAAARYGELVAEFDGSVRPFWDSLGVDMEPVTEAGRYRGTLRTPPGGA